MRAMRLPIMLCHREPAPCTLEGLAAWAGVPPERLQRYVDDGLLEPLPHAGVQPLCDAAALHGCGGSSGYAATGALIWLVWR
jgi:hypothetical protein